MSHLRVQPYVCQRIHVLGGGPVGCNPTNTIEKFILGSDVAQCQITVATCLLQSMSSSLSTSSSSSASSDERRRKKKSHQHRPVQQQQRVKRRLSSASSDSNQSDKGDDDDFMKRLSKRPTKVTQRRSSGRQQSLYKGYCPPVLFTACLVSRLCWIVDSILKLMVWRDSVCITT